ncbi:hypothetical protein [Paraburkholderia sediminicola]|uniref:hypothetical protein n=1 Tax=Paraburkholderia sediminicola TaxID=458836 RepID=UPI0038BD8A5A
MRDLDDGRDGEASSVTGVRCLGVELQSVDECAGRFTVMITRTQSLVLSPMRWMPDDPLLEVCAVEFVLSVGDEEVERFRMDGSGWRQLAERCLAEKIWTRVLLGERIDSVMADFGMRFR